MPARQSHVLEKTARDALNSGIGRAFTDAEWERRRQRLLEFTKILRDWDHKVKQIDTVDRICKPEK